MKECNRYNIYIRDRQCPYTGFWMFMNGWQTEKEASDYANNIQSDCPHWDVSVMYDDHTIWAKDGVKKEVKERQDV